MDIHHQYQISKRTLKCFPILKEEAVRANAYNEGMTLNIKTPFSFLKGFQILWLIFWIKVSSVLKN
jgi:hypothetical protein